MSIRHQVQNQLIELFLTASSEIIPTIPVEIKKTGDSLTTVEYESKNTEEDESVVFFISEFDKLNN